MKLLRFLLIASTLAVVSIAGADDARVQQAVRASLLGNATEVRSLARDQRADEKNGVSSEKISENIAVLAATTARPLPTLDNAKSILSGFRTDQSTRNLDRLLRRVEPRQRFIEARKDARYESLRRIFNGILSPLSSAARGQFFALISLPFEAAEQLVTGNKFLSPEQRKELAEAKNVNAQKISGGLPASPRTVASEWNPKRRALSALEGKQNGEKFQKEGVLQTADFWFQQEMKARGWKAPRNPGHEKLLAQAKRLEGEQRVSVAIVDGDSLIAHGGAEKDYATVLREFIADPQSAAFQSAAKQFSVSHEFNRAAPDVIAAKAAASDDPPTQHLLLQQVASETSGRWSVRAAAILRRPENDPAPALAAAKQKLDARKRNFVISGADPETAERSYTAEEARLRRGSWVSRARGLFVTDSLSRLLFLPFTDPAPRPELLDAAAKANPNWYDGAEGRKWLRTVARAQAVEKRYEDAAQSYRRLGDPSRASAMRQKAAKLLETIGDRAADDRTAATAYERLLNAYPDYKKMARVKESLALARVRRDAVATITVEEFRAWPELRRIDGFAVPDALVDGKKGNGEVTKDGVAIMKYDAISYADKTTGRRSEQPLTAPAKEEILRLLIPRRRSSIVSTEIAKPLPRKRIPASVEAGAFPGFDAAPALVPLTPNPRERELYQ